jgi:hypothetical protein
VAHHRALAHGIAHRAPVHANGMRTIHLFTIAAGNYLPKVRVLFHSVRKWHPDWRLHVVIADTPRDPKALAALGHDEVHHLPELGIPNWRRWAFGHTLIELATAMKPFALRRLLTRPDAKAVIFLDPDIVLFSALGEIVEGFEAADMLLTPHLTSPESSLHGIVANELCTSQHGIYNLGFIGVAARAEGRRFVDWWAERLFYFCREDIPNGIYTDQRWIDFVPAFFENTRILRSPRLNVAPWNLSTRRLEGDIARGFTVEGKPLGFYHFSQVDSAANDGATASQASAIELVSWYRRETQALPDERLAPPAWNLGVYADGTSISVAERRVYRLRDDLQRAFADPYQAGPDSFRAWWLRHASREYPALFRPGERDEALRRLLTDIANQRIGDTAAGVSLEIDRRHAPWLDESEATP